MRKKISLLGSTGSIGQSTLRVVEHLSDQMEIVCLACRSNIDLLEKQALQCRPQLLAVEDEQAARVLQRRLPWVDVLAGAEGLREAARFSAANFILVAIAGKAALQPTLFAIEAGKSIGLASKEVLVCAGEWICLLARKHQVTLLPIDSEHSAIFQCLQGESVQAIQRVILTASGGPFRQKSPEELKRVSLEQALCHPNWKMGPKVTVDSSTLMNKGLEMIEARWLFDLDPQKIEAVIHPQSIVHSFVEFQDGSLIAQLSEPDMVLPIQYALTYPRREKRILPPFDFSQARNLTFYPPDLKAFPCLQLAIDSLKEGRSYPCYLNAANEILVERFLKKEFSWIEIGEKLEKLMSSHRPENLLTLDAILSMDAQAREEAKKIR